MLSCQHPNRDFSFFLSHSLPLSVFVLHQFSSTPFHPVSDFISTDDLVNSDSTDLEKYSITIVTHRWTFNLTKYYIKYTLNAVYMFDIPVHVKSVLLLSEANVWTTAHRTEYAQTNCSRQKPKNNDKEGEKLLSPFLVVNCL